MKFRSASRIRERLERTTFKPRALFGMLTEFDRLLRAPYKFRNHGAYEAARYQQIWILPVALPPRIRLSSTYPRTFGRDQPRFFDRGSSTVSSGEIQQSLPSTPACAERFPRFGPGNSEICSGLAGTLDQTLDARDWRLSIMYLSPRTVSAGRLRHTPYGCRFTALSSPENSCSSAAGPTRKGRARPRLGKRTLWRFHVPRSALGPPILLPYWSISAPDGGSLRLADRNIGTSLNRRPPDPFAPHSRLATPLLIALNVLTSVRLAEILDRVVRWQA